MKKSLFKVNVSKDIFVMADSMEEAERLAVLNRDEECSEWKTSSFLINNSSNISEEILDTLFFGIDEDVTIREYLMELRQDLH